jgi:Spy/CpxP family protein refolding chaperone
MRTTQVVLGLILATSVGATFCVAQVLTERPASATDRAQDQSPDNQGNVLAVSIQDIELTDDQEAQINAIRKEYRPKIEEDAKELKSLAKEEVDQIRNVLTPEQKPKIQALVEQRREFREESLANRIAGLKELDLTEAELAKITEIRQEYRPKMEQAVKQLEGLLTDAQKQAREQALKADKPRREVVKALNLTPDQKTELQNVAKNLKDLVGNELAKIQGVLTSEQRETLQDLRSERRELVRDQLAHQIANLRDLNVTQQQKDSLMNIRQEFRPKIQEAGNQLRTEIGEEIGKIVAVLKPTGVVAERPESVR